MQFDIDSATLTKHLPVKTETGIASRKVRNILCMAFVKLISAISVPAQLNMDLPAFPQAEGFGAYAKGGRGGKVIFVTNLNDDGPGSLRSAVMDPNPRIVIFRVSGTINLKSNLVISHPYITIAGQTAPGDGICLMSFLLKINNTHDVIVRGIRVRPGIRSGLPGDAIDGIDMEYSYNIILDHCSASWSCDEILNTNKSNRDITVQWCIFSESLNNSIHPKGEHGYAATIGGYRASYHHNLFAHNQGRNPSIGGSDESRTALLDFRNNVVYNWVSRICDGKPRTMNFAANYYKQGPATPLNNEYIIAEIQASEKYGYTSKWYIEDNYVNNYPSLTEDNWKGAVRYNDGTSMEKNREYRPFENARYMTWDATQAYVEVLDHAGVTVPRRDTVDNRVIRDVQTGNATFGNGIIDNVEQVGGWPELLTYDVPLDIDNDGMPDEWERQEGLNFNDPFDRLDIKEGEVYDNLERYLNELASDKPYLLPPVNLVASLQNGTEVLLKWEDITSDELGFVIQRTDASGAFFNIDTVGANVTSFADTPPVPDRTIIYRAFAMNSELTSVPSKSSSIELLTGLQDIGFNKGLTAFPNPFDGQFTFTYYSSSVQIIGIRMFSSGGILMKDLKNVPAVAGANNITISAERLSPGIYILEYRPEEGKAGYIKVIRK